MTNKIATVIDQNEIAAGVFLDLSKAFDTLNHEILFSKLGHYGIRGVALNWMKVILIIENNFIASYNKCGVPQGSILGSLLFILYINDLPNASHLAETLLFADDTSTCYSNSDPVMLASVVNEALENISLWMRANQLSVNTDKTYYVIFKSKQKKTTFDIPLLLGDKLINREKQVKFLGVLLHENLSWKPHINHVCKKISKAVGVTYRNRFTLSSTTKLHSNLPISYILQHCLVFHLCF